MNLPWSSIQEQSVRFIDERLSDSESDLLYAIERKGGGAPAWLYVLLEHQSTPDAWLRLRLLKYSVRIWERDRRRHPNEEHLHAGELAAVAAAGAAARGTGAGGAGNRRRAPDRADRGVQLAVRTGRVKIPHGQAPAADRDADLRRAPRAELLLRGQDRLRRPADPRGQALFSVAPAAVRQESVPGHAEGAVRGQRGAVRGALHPPSPRLVESAIRWCGWSFGGGNFK